jgi:hypothetical protein
MRAPSQKRRALVRLPLRVMTNATTMMRRSLAVIATLVVVVGAWLVVRGKGVHAEPNHVSMGVAKVLTVQPQQLRAFSILRAPPETPPPNTRLAIEKAVEGRGFGLILTLGHRVPTLLGEYVWVVPGNGFICIVGNQPVVAGCNTTVETIQHGMSVVAIDPPLSRHKAKRYILYGVTPDHVKAVAVKREDGRRTTVPVVNNVYSYRAPTMIYAKLIR